MEDHFGCLVKSLQLECDHDSIAKKKVPRRRRRGTSVPPTNSEEVTSILGNTLKSTYFYHFVLKYLFNIHDDSKNCI